MTNKFIVSLAPSVGKFGSPESGRPHFSGPIQVLRKLTYLVAPQKCMPTKLALRHITSAGVTFPSDTFIKSNLSGNCTAGGISIFAPATHKSRIVTPIVPLGGRMTIFPSFRTRRRRYSRVSAWRSIQHQRSCSSHSVYLGPIDEQFITALQASRKKPWQRCCR